MNRFKLYAVAIAGVLAMTCASAELAREPIERSYSPTVTQANGVDYVLVKAEPADLKSQAKLQTATQPTSAHEPVMYKRHWQAVTRLAIYVEDLPIRPRS